MTPHDDERIGFTDLDDEALLEALREAVDPRPIAHDRNERLIEAALSEGLASVGDDESTDAASRDSSDLSDCDAELIETLRAAYLPESIDSTALDTIARQALGQERRATVVGFAHSRRRAQVVAALAMAAAVAIAFGVGRRRDSGSERAVTEPEALAISRSVAPLFAETFSRATPTERIDRIYAVRSRELRHNRYAAWRVR